MAHIGKSTRAFDGSIRSWLLAVALLFTGCSGFYIEADLRTTDEWEATIARMRDRRGCEMTDEEQAVLTRFFSENYAGETP